MPLMQWNNGLDVGVDNMNLEHKLLLDIMNRLYDLKKNGKSGKEAVRAARDLREFTITHFGSEEDYMEMIDYADIKAHKALHASLLEKLDTHVALIEARNGEIPDAFFEFLKLWLSAHIKGTDTQYGDHAKSRSAA